MTSAPACQAPTLEVPFDEMLANYEFAVQSYVSDHKSRHWDVFRRDYDQLIRDTRAWPEFRSNGISDYLDTTIEKSGLPAARIITAPKEFAALSRRYNSLAAITGTDFVRSCAEAEIGQPRFGEIDGKKLNVPDLRHIFNAWRIQSIWPILHPLPPPERPLIAEIGAGYGGLALKLKHLIPSAKIVLFDLPQVNAIQTYYLHHAMPEARVLGAKDFAESDPATLLASEWDFLVLPGWYISDLPDGAVTLCINARSMMEMQRSVADFYIREIQRLIPPDGAFYCVNRYTKSTVGEAIRLKEYSFDNKWGIAVSEPAWDQPWVHELLLLRLKYDSALSTRELLATLPPYRWKDFLGHIGKSAKILIILLWGANPNVNPGLSGTIRNAKRRIERSMVRSIRKFPSLHNYLKCLRQTLTGA